MEYILIQDPTFQYNDSDFYLCKKIAVKFESLL